MKLNKLALTLIAAALLPAFAYAGTDGVATSFERDMQREPISSAAVITGEPDPLVGIFNAALYGTTDPVLASFERDMNHEQVVSQFVSAADPLADLFYAALYGTTDPVLASFERDMRYEPVNSAAVLAGAADPLTEMFNVALRDEAGKPVRHAAITGSHPVGN